MGSICRRYVADRGWVIDRVIRTIARWSSEEFVISNVMKRDETFGALGQERYRIELELRLDRGR